MSISAVYYRKADGVIFVFDTTRPRSFTNVVSVWMNAVDAQERLSSSSNTNCLLHMTPLVDCVPSAVYGY